MKSRKVIFMRRLFFLVFLSLMLAGCSSGADRKSENRRDQTETAAEEEECEGVVQEAVSSEDDMTAEEIMSFLESFEPGLSLWTWMQRKPKDMEMRWKMPMN